MKLAVVGGGPVGIYTAIELANKGHQVDLYEKRDWPVDKTCGQGVMPSGIRLLNSIGVNFSPPNDSYAFHGISYFDSETMIEGRLPETAHGIERKVLSQKLIDVARKTQNLTIYAKTNVEQVRGEFTSQVSLYVNAQEINYDYIFACDGLNSKIRKSLHNRKVRKGSWRLGAREHFEIPPWSNMVEVYWNNGVEAYVTPVNANKVEVAFLWFDDLNLSKNQLKQDLWSHFPQLQEKLSEAKACNDFRGYGPFSTISKREKIGRVFFVGDAYQFLDGITGEGISLGLKASHYITGNFEKWSWMNSLKLGLIYWHYKFMVNLALMLSTKLILRRFIFRCCQVVPKLFQMILRLNDL